MTVDQLRTRSIMNFLSSLQPPVHVILLYRKPSEMDNIRSIMEAETPSTTAQRHGANQIFVVSSTREKEADRWVVNMVGQRHLSNPARLMELEERIKKTHQPRMVMCAYPLTETIELDQNSFVEILSLHDYILFSGFMEDEKMILDAVEVALKSFLGDNGSEMIYRYAQQLGIERKHISDDFRRFRRVLRELLGIGADLIERSIFQRLYLRLRSIPGGI